MRALPEEPLRQVAVEAEHLEPRREFILHQPSVEHMTSADRLAVLGPVVVDVVDAHEVDFRFPTAGALPLVAVVHRLLEFGANPPVSYYGLSSVFCADAYSRIWRARAVTTGSSISTFFSRAFVGVAATGTGLVARLRDAVAAASRACFLHGLDHIVYRDRHVRQNLSELLRVRAVDGLARKRVKSGELTGFSIGGSAVRRPEVVRVAA